MEYLGKNITQFPKDPGMHVIKYLDLWLLSFIMWFRTCSLLIVALFPLPTHPPRKSGTWNKWEALLPVKTEAKNLKYLSLSHHHQFTLLASEGEYTLFVLSYLTYVLIETHSVVLHIPWQVLFSFTLVSVIPSPHIGAVSLSVPQATCPCSHWLCISFLVLNLRSRSLLNHSGLQPALLDFLRTRMKCFCALRKVTISAQPLCS